MIRTRKPSKGPVFKFVANPFDKINGVSIKDGTLVRKCQPHGCPKNGTMGMCCVEDMEGNFLEMVCQSSLFRIGRKPAKVSKYWTWDPMAIQREAVHATYGKKEQAK